MNILAFDTCLGACSVAVRRAGVPPVDRGQRALMATGHAEALMPMIERVLAAADLAPRAIDRIAVTHGPGTFTGTRIGVAAARALALATGGEVVAVSSLRVLGLTLLRRCAGHPLAIDRLLVAVAARNNEAYVQVLDGVGVEMSDPQILTVEAAAMLASKLGVAVAGSAAAAVEVAAAVRGRQFIALPAAACADCEPDAVVLLDIAAGLTPAAAPPSPLYLRQPDAKPPSSPALPRVGR